MDTPAKLYLYGRISYEQLIIKENTGLDVEEKEAKRLLLGIDEIGVICLRKNPKLDKKALKELEELIEEGFIERMRREL